MDRPIIFSAPMIRAIRREIAAPGTGKTQTRRILKPQPPTPEQFPGSVFGFDRAVADGVKVYSLNDLDRLPKHPTKWDLCGSVGVARNAGFPVAYRVPFTVGDRLWVRESIALREDCGIQWATYAADGAWVKSGIVRVDPRKIGCKARPSINMPRWASRLTLLVTDVRVERLNAISHADALAEGVEIESADPPFYYVSEISPCSLTAVGVEEPGGRHAERSFGKLWEHINGAGSWDANPWVVAVSFQPLETNIDRMPERQAAPVPAAAE